MIITSYSNIDLIQGVIGYGNATEGITDWRLENTGAGVFNILNSSSIITPSGGTTEISQIANSSYRYMIFKGGTSTFTVPAGGIVCDILVVGGGGAGGAFGGGGGAGQVLYGTNVFINSGTVNINVGNGGVTTTGLNVSQNGFDSSITIGGITYSSVGGGGGGGRNSANFAVFVNGNDGGSGGGGNSPDSSTPAAIGGLGGSSTKTSYSGWISYGNSGGYGCVGDTHLGGGGGGAGGVGGSVTLPSTSGAGGIGVDFSSIFGTSVGANGWFGGGGGGCLYATGSGGLGGTGGGGKGAQWSPNTPNGVDGTVNTGGGGGASGLTSGYGYGTGGAGGSGIVIIRYYTANLSIIDNGNVGIGTPPITSSSKLEILGDVNITGVYRKNNRDIITDTSNYVLTTSNVLVPRIITEVGHGSNYLSRIATQLNTSINDTSNYVAITSNLLANRVSSQWNNVTKGIHFTPSLSISPIITSTPVATTIGVTGDYTYHTFTYTTETAGTGTGQTQYTFTVPSGGMICDILVVGGGGAGGGNGGGGGGAGGYVYITNVVLNQGTYTVRVGSGGIGTINANTNGKNSSLIADNNSISYTSLGGGFGGSRGSSALATSGGSGGGGGGISPGIGQPSIQFSTYGYGVGFSGGNGFDGGYDSAGAGGGGAGSSGTTAGNKLGGNGGDGVANTITGTSVIYCAGGGGGISTNTGTGTIGTNGSSGNGSFGSGSTGGGLNVGASSGTNGIVIIRYISSTRNVGIGIINPINELHVYDETTTNTKLTIQNNKTNVLSETSVSGSIPLLGKYRGVIFPYSGSGTTTTYSFTTTASLVCDILIVGGGGGGGFNAGGGGGAGGVVIGTNIYLPIGTYTIVVGNGGIPASTAGGYTINGNDSSITIGGTTITAKGGGGGVASLANAASGGSGGGGASDGNYNSSSAASNQSATQTLTGYGINGTNVVFNGYGNAGGIGRSQEQGGWTRASAGGGGAGSAGYNSGDYVLSDLSSAARFTFGGRGGDGRDVSSIFGTNVGVNGFVGGGGGGSTHREGTRGAGGIGGGGGGGIAFATASVNIQGENGVDGIASTGGGGGGGSGGGGAGGKGGSGVVVIKYVRYQFRYESQSSSLELITTTQLPNIPNEIVVSGTTFGTLGTSDRIITFPYTGSGATKDYTFTTTEVLNCDILIIGGGGSGGGGYGGTGGGGGAGGIIYYTSYNIQVGTYTVNVGKGANARTTYGDGNNGTASSFVLPGTTLTAAGGLGGFWTTIFGGASGAGINNGVAYSSYPGGNPSSGTNYAAGGGGGASQAGKNPSGNTPGNGGDGLQIPITGIYTYYGGGGGGGCNTANISSSGGLGGGGGVPVNSNNGINGLSGTGGGGGGFNNVDGNSANYKAGDGGSGIVIIRYRKANINKVNINYKVGNYNDDFKIISSIPSLIPSDTDFMRITRDGASIYNPTGSPLWSTVSDRRIKENIEKASYDKCYESINKLELYRFSYIKELNNINRDIKQLGYIAQEVQDIFPKAVSTQEFNNDNISISDMLSIDVTQINYSLYGAVKKLIEIDNNKEERLKIIEYLLNIDSSSNNIITNTSTSNLVVDTDMSTSNLVVDTDMSTSNL